jgi:hypothetical protein
MEVKQLGHNSFSMYRRACACLEAGVSNQNDDRAREVHYQRPAICCDFLWAKGRKAKHVHKEIFSVYSGKFLPRKAVQNWMANVSLMAKLKQR